MIHRPDQRVGVFIDTQNMYYSARFLHQKKVQFPQIVEKAVGKRRLIRAIAYVVTTKGGEERPFHEALEKSGIELREKELQEFNSGEKKADWDVGLTIDVVRMLDMLDVVVLVSGDGDFEPLISYCQSRGRIVEVMAFRHTTSSKLLEVADHYINLSDFPRIFLIPNRRNANHAHSANPSHAPEEPSAPKPSSHSPDEEGPRSKRLSF